jgi:protocatechuate 3,4-dioxygenase beta subunit
MTFKRMFLVFLALLTFNLVSLAQVDRAVLEGAVTDPGGAVIVGANVKIRAADTGITQEQQTNSNGYYRFPGLAVGRYTVTEQTPASRPESSRTSRCRSARPAR